ncbi:MAG: N-6 DNA methylase [Planctomycetota bacterium]|nr:N-6 DNA methylase [Planctomycetota bacterium]
MNAAAFDEAFQRVRQLADTFKANEQRYLSAEYQEAEARKDFIDKFWMALGWDVNHDQQTNPYAQEVKVERTHGHTQRRADYAFYLAPNYRDVRFFVEAKKPFRDIARADNYFQTLTYGYSAGTPLAVVTDFAQFHVLDCRYEPSLQTALQHAVATWHYSDYSDREKFALLYWLFSREAVAGGWLQKWAEDLPKPRARPGKGRAFVGVYRPADEALLAKLDDYREELAKAFKKCNPRLDSDTLTEITQRAIDRLVFLRFLEDKQIEPTPLVDQFGDKAPAWGEFIAASHRLDGIYNGVVFKKHVVLDDPAFRVDNRTFAGICQRLSHANSPYNFDAIPIHILGSIYERFLGKVIVATDKRVRVEEKPEVRKAGGVYYTPEYIVRYIVENTVGKLIAGKTPDQIAGMRFADIACGSGSFLLGVYDLLLQYHGTWYNANPRKARKGDCIEYDGKLYLSLNKKRDILLNNIFGVDISSQAVEVCQLSLYLKLLEEETLASTKQYLLDFAQEALLPPLNRNIVCGNSLIGRDVLEGQLFDNGDERELKPMNFDDAFPEVMKRGGFDAVIGNPPYVRIQGFPREQIEYLTRHYRSATGNCDVYVSFVERAYGLLKPGGRLGYIVPNKFFRTDYGVGLRELLATKNAVMRIVDFGANQVFGATTYTCLLFLANQQQGELEYAQIPASGEALASASFSTIAASALTREPWLFTEGGVAVLARRLAQQGKRLLDLPVEMSRGSSTGDDRVFVVPANTRIEKEALRVPVYATDIKRYLFTPNPSWRVIFPYEVSGQEARLLSEPGFRRRYPKTYAHLRNHQAQLKQRKQYAEWFGFSAPRNLPLHDCAHILVPLLAARGQFALIPEAWRGKLCPMASGGFTITALASCPVRAEYLLGLLNSRLLFWRLQQTSNLFRGGWVTCTKQYFGELPVAIGDEARQDQMVRLVKQMLHAKEQLARATTEEDRSFYTAKCTGLGRDIDRLVYDLYGLTEEEIALVEKTAT